MSAYYDKDIQRNVTAEDISRALKFAAGALDYPGQKGIPVRRVDTHSLRSGGANALCLAGYEAHQIQKMGRWWGATFKEYIRDELASYASGMSRAMKQKFNFVNVASGAFADMVDVTRSTIGQGYAAPA